MAPNIAKRGGQPLPATALERDQPQAGLFVLGIEVQAVRILALGQDHRYRTFELLQRYGRSGDLVDPMSLHVVCPPSIALVDARPAVRRSAQQLDELVVIELRYFPAGHGMGTLYRLLIP